MLRRAFLGVISFGLITIATLTTMHMTAQSVLADDLTPEQTQALQEGSVNFDSDTTTTEAASTNEAHQSDEASHAQHFGIVFAMFALVLVAGKLGNFVERFGQPAVIGELFAGIVLSGLGYFGWGFIDETLGNQVIAYVASFGALLLLFSIGLESKISEMKKVGFNALIVAAIGVVVPFVLGTYFLAPALFPDASSNAKIFVGAAMVATSVGITAAVFRSLGIIKTRAAQTVLGAAVIDDVLGLIVLAVVSALATGGEVTPTSVGIIAAKSFGFLAAALLVGAYLAKGLSRVLSKVNTGIGMKLTLAVGFALLFGYLAELFGLEPIIGAFAAGLLLEEVHFRSFADPEVVHELRSVEFKNDDDKTAVANVIRRHSDAHVEDLIGSIGMIFIPVFFVYTGMQIDFGSLLQPKLYVTAMIISVFAIVGKVVAGTAAKGSAREKLLVGVSMVPRGEVGLIFAATGKALGVLSDELFSVIVLVVIITTFVAPPLIKYVASSKPLGFRKAQRLLSVGLSKG